jgi:hypothetical protein
MSFGRSTWKHMSTVAKDGEYTVNMQHVNCWRVFGNQFSDFCFVLAGMFVAAAIKELRQCVLPSMVFLVSHYTMVAISQQAGECSSLHRIWFTGGGIWSPLSYSCGCCYVIATVVVFVVLTWWLWGAHAVSLARLNILTPAPCPVAVRCVSCSTVMFRNVTPVYKLSHVCHLWCSGMWPPCINWVTCAIFDVQECDPRV